MEESFADKIDLPPAPGDISEPVGQPLPDSSAPSKKRPRIWPIFAVLLLGLFLAVGLQGMVAGFAAARLQARGIDKSSLNKEIMEWLTTPEGFLVILACGQIGFALPTILAASRSPEPFKRRLGLVPLRNPVQISALTAVGSLLPLAVSFGLAYLVLQIIPADESFEKFFDKITAAWGIVFVCAIALAPGFFEEMLYRGYIQQRLLQRWTPPVAIGVATLLFTLAHVTPHAMAAAFPLGLWFGVIAWRVGSIVPTIVCHAFVNGGLNAWRLVAKFGELSDTTQLVGNCLFVGLGAICFVLACQRLAEYQPPKLPTASAQSG